MGRANFNSKPASLNNLTEMVLFIQLISAFVLNLDQSK